MEKMLMKKRQFMDLCKSVFDFEEFGIKPCLKDIKKYHDGRRYLRCYFLDQEDNSYLVDFIYNGICEFYVYVYKELDFNRYEYYSNDHFCLIENGLKLLYHSGKEVLKNI